MRFLFSLLLFYRAFLANAQDLSIGLHGAYSNNSILNQAVYNKNNSGLNIGANTQYGFNKYFAAYAELNYEVKGAKGEIAYYNSIGEQMLSYTKIQYLNYATLPVMARVLIGKEKPKIFFNGGIYYGFLVNAWVNPQDKNVDHTVTADFKRNDFGLCGGAGVQYSLHKNYLLRAEWRYNYGLMNISQAANDHFNRSNIFQLGVAYRIVQKVKK